MAIQKKYETGVKTGDMVRMHGVSKATLYSWKAKYGAWTCLTPDG